VVVPDKRHVIPVYFTFKTDSASGGYVDKGHRLHLWESLLILHLGARHTLLPVAMKRSLHCNLSYARDNGLEEKIR
jgi:hypothetical protein